MVDVTSEKMLEKIPNTFILVLVATERLISNSCIAVGVTASIAAYKSCDLVSKLRQENAEVRVIMTPSATKLVGELTFFSLSGNPVLSDMFGGSSGLKTPHISIAGWADLLVIAPATANIIGKTVAGIADDLLSTTIITVKCPVIFAPAMNSNMYENKIVQQNIKKLAEIGYQVVEPETGYLACGYEGKGRLASTTTIMEKISGILSNRKHR